jgi:hypothetical protein
MPVPKQFELLVVLRLVGFVSRTVVAAIRGKRLSPILGDANGCKIVPISTHQ